MKTIKILFIILLLASCKKEKDCKICTWSAEAGGTRPHWYPVKEEERCDENWKMLENSRQIMYDGSGKKVNAKCNCK